jgi:predicted transposase/invertase (TIGR01784 family)
MENAILLSDRGDGNLMDNMNSIPWHALDITAKESIKEYFGIDVDSDIFSPMVDYAFKRIFTADEERSKIALIDFLNSVLEFEDANNIVDLTVINSQIPVDIITRKKAIFDIRVKFNHGEQAIVEMQLSSQSGFKKRSQYIISKAYTSQNLAGLDYTDLKKCYLVCVTNFVLWENKSDFISDYRYRDNKGVDLSDDETIIFIELPKIDRVLNKPVSEMTNIEMWAVFFRYVTDKSKREILNQIIGRKAGIEMAAQVLTEISKDERERVQYESELIFDLDYRTGMNSARREGETMGEDKGIRKVARNLLIMGLPLEQISTGTGLPVDEIKKLNANL